MSVRIAFPDHIYDAAARYYEFRDVGPSIVGLVSGFLAQSGFLAPTNGDGAVLDPVHQAQQAVANVDYSAQWADLGLADDPDDKGLMAAKALLIAKRGEEGAVKWMLEKRRNGITSPERFLMSWWRDNRE